MSAAHQLASECATKQRWDNHGDAMKAVRHMKRNGVRKAKRRTHSGATVYRCPHCAGWHIVSSQGMARSYTRRLAG